jgi:hypothetical protein
VANTYVNYLLNSEMRSREFDVLRRVMAEVPIRRVRAAGDPSRVFELCEAIGADARRLPDQQAALGIKWKSRGFDFPDSRKA